MSEAKLNKATKRFVERCLKCKVYDSGRCEEYNKQMDAVVEKKEEPECDHFGKKKEK